MHFLAQPHMFMHLVDDLVPAYLVVTICYLISCYIYFQPLDARFFWICKQCYIWSAIGGASICYLISCYFKLINLRVTIYEFMHQLLVVELYLMIHVPGLKLFIFRSYLICCLVKLYLMPIIILLHNAELHTRINWPAQVKSWSYVLLIYLQPLDARLSCSYH